ncbi:hypothetical protein BGW38_003106 [Lunasporangiospora selenospora]|uniref:GH18 domain-containing protein n=1 Tax=Lunasporangiospora selenospora TaxID=979761 RepID=A0A9P6FRV4_9FUNG|nr:hypothetical protein BGW38_003106 [Lunasporangiospora selenospora]
MKCSFIVLALLSAAAVFAAPSTKRAFNSSEKAVIGYFEPLHGFPIDMLDFNKYTHINYAFSYMWKGAPDPYVIYVNYDVEGPKIKELVRRGHANDVKIIMSIGGWYGSQTFSQVAADPARRKKWVESAMVFLRPNTLGDNAHIPNGWNMDGLDIDWEYPGKRGADCNTFTPKDTENYLLLLQEVRAQMDLEFPNNQKTISSAVSISPWVDENGNPLTDVSAFVPIFDWVNIMVYDIHGPWSDPTGPNAPLYSHPSPEAASADRAIRVWSAAGWPKEKIALGTPFYGRAFTATVNMNTRNPISQYAPHTLIAPKGGPADSNATFPLCIEKVQFWGFWNWAEIREHILVDSLKVPVSGWKKYYDNITKTPWLFRESDYMFVSYDDLDSMSLKVDFARSHGLKGLFMWEAQMDYKDELLTVLNQIHCSSKECVCQGVAAWDTTKVYAQPNVAKVTYGGRLWTNKWWTRGDQPKAVGWNAWKDLGAC